MSSSIYPEKYRPHALCIPFPAQGHINPMLKVAKLLHHKGFHITFVNSEYNHRRLLRSRGPNALNGLPSFRFETIPDGLPCSDADATQDIPALLESTTTTCLGPFKELISRLNNTSSSSNIPPVTCIVSDGVMGFTLDASQELGLPNVVFWTTSACGLLGYVNYHQLVKKGLIPLKDLSCLTNGYMENIIDWIPGMENIRLKDLPTFLRVTDPNDFVLNFAITEIERFSTKASAVILNTFNELERDTLNTLTSTFTSKIYTTGPLHLLENQIPDNELKNIGSNLWKDDDACLTWLDSKEPNSVVYVNFGSITVITPQQMIEFAWGLAKSNQTFLWIIRPDLVVGDSAMLPSEFVSETKERGFWANWCPQEQVLNHPSIGGFLSHCGWNSTLESISAGVPLICWPFFADQQTNCWYCCTRLGIAMEIDNNVKRDDVAKLVLELMIEEKGKEMRKKTIELKKLAEKVITSTTDGSSYNNFDQLISNVLISSVSN
uniref:Glycosyltransferase n=1 Tax=Nemophila menziesii TaxID=79376 RepID=A0A387II19_NEMME|nr:glucosyltransferase 14 [Nemophila menziesii]